MGDRNIKSMIKSIFEEYKSEFNCLHGLEILPEQFTNESIEEIAHVHPDEMRTSLENNSPIIVHYKRNLLNMDKKLIKAVFYHEFTHVRDYIDWLSMGEESKPIMLKTLSEYNAKRIDFLVRCDNQIVGLDTEIPDYDGMITPRKEIEGHLKNIINTFEIQNNSSEKNEDKLLDVVHAFMATFSYMFALLSFYEETETEYFESCFDRLDKYDCKGLAKALYDAMKDSDSIIKNPMFFIKCITVSIANCFMRGLT